MAQTHTPLRRSDVRSANELLVLKLIRESSGISQSKVAGMTGLKPPTIFRIFTTLENQGLILPGGKARNSENGRGRRPQNYVVNAKAYFAVGLDFWSRMISIVIVDFAGEIAYEDAVDIKKPEASRAAAQLADLVRTALSNAKIPRKRVLGIGIGCPGRVDLHAGTIISYGRIRNMQNFPIRDYLSKELKIPVRIHNNGSVIAQALYRRGVGKSYKSLIVILIRSGVGGAFISDGKIFVNHHRTSLEIGHMPISIGGELCKCGARGCLETHISEDVLVAESEVNGNIRSFSDFDKAAVRGEKNVVAYLKEKANVLAVAMRSLVQLFGPEAIVVVSRSVAVSDILAGSAAEVLSQDALFSENNKVAVLSEVYDSAISGHGAADIVFDGFFEDITAISEKS
jgi:N-acetylglucosamine repressor